MNTFENIGLHIKNIFGIKNASGTTINPATEEKQDDILAKMPTLESNGGVPVNIQDQTSQIVDLYLHKDLGGVYSVNTNTTIDTNTVIINASTPPVAGDSICLKEDSRFYQARVVSFTGTNPYTITLDTPLDYAFTTAAFICLSNFNLAVNGAVTPQVFHVSPPSGTRWDIVRIIIHIEDNVAMDNGKFGGLAALSKGLVIRHKNGVYQNIFNVKTNGEMAERSYDVSYDDKAPAGVYGFRCRSTFGGQSKRGVVVRLESDHSDEFQAIIQDDLTGLNSLHIVCQGHVVQD